MKELTAQLSSEDFFAVVVVFSVAEEVVSVTLVDFFLVVVVDDVSDFVEEDCFLAFLKLVLGAEEAPPPPPKGIWKPHGLAGFPVAMSPLPWRMPIPLEAAAVVEAEAEERQEVEARLSDCCWALLPVELFLESDPEARRL